MRDFAWTYIQGAVARVPTSLVVGLSNFALASIECTQKIILGGSLSTNLAELFSLTSSGELEIVAAYTVQTAAGVTAPV
jgi:hypothetical protein